VNNNRPRLEDTSQVVLPWIVRLRYGIPIAQIVAALFVEYVLGIGLPLTWIILVSGFVGISNLLLVDRIRRPHLPRSFSTSMLVEYIFVFDTVCLTVVLMLTGGPTNPFSVLYLVHITLSATILTKRQTLLLGGFSGLCFGALFLVYRPIPVLEMAHDMPGADLHLIGMWISFLVTAFMVTTFSGKISKLLREREDSMLRMQGELAKRDRLASLVTLAAGAAHELNTPLSTIAVVAKELEVFATDVLHSDGVGTDCRLIRDEVNRCQKTLWKMSARGAEPAALALEAVPVDQLFQEVCEEIAQASRVKVELPDRAPLRSLRVPRHSVQQALVALLKNALEASPSTVFFSAKCSGEFLQFRVKDTGSGMSEEILRRVGEPFFTTKETGKGMGLGTFVAKTLAEQLGGSLTYESSLGAGTVAVLELPMTLEPEAWQTNERN